MDHTIYLSEEVINLYTRDASDTSIAAAESLDIPRLEAMILDDIELSGVWGMTQDDLIAMHPGYSYSSITARPASLKRKGLIFDSGERRAGKSGRSQAVLKAAKHQTLDTNDQHTDSDGNPALF
jgi:hypothetical protein